MGRERLWSSGGTSSSLTRGDFCKESSSDAAPPGCMSGVLHYLHFHHLLFNGGSRSPTPESSSTLSLSSPAPLLPPRADPSHRGQLRGFEAPRNSLELDEGIMAASSLSREDEFYDVPVPIEISSEEKKESSQQQVETPRSARGIVARLMGLEISPDHASPKMPQPPPQQQLQVLRSEKKSRKSFDGDLRCCTIREHDSLSPRHPLRCLDRNAAAADGAGSRSLPETPRVSSSSARRSCELNKENHVSVTTTGDHRPLPHPPPAYTTVKTKKGDSGKHQDRNKSPRSHHFAREIVEQVKESIATGLGDHGGQPEEIKSKSKRRREATPADPPSPRSPLQLYKVDDGETKNNTSETTKMILNKCKKADSERFTERIIKKQQKRAPTTLVSLFLSADILSARENSNPDINRPRPTVSITSPVNLPSVRSSTPTPRVATQQLKDQNKGDLELRRYIKFIFERAGISGVRSLRWSSPLLPIDTIVFDELELKLPLFTGHLRLRWNRKLVFYLVEEILGDLLLSCSAPRTTVGSNEEETLLRRVCGQIESFPAEGSDVDLYALISRDLPEANVRGLLRHPSVLEEAEDVGYEVEWEILDSLVGETAASLALSTSLPPAAGGGGGVDPRRNLWRHC